MNFLLFLCYSRDVVVIC